MTFPFSPYATHVDNSVPKVTADELNEGQNVYVSLMWRDYHARPEVRMVSKDFASVDVVLSPLVILDAVTAQITYCAYGNFNITPGDLDVPAVSFPANSWVYLYAYSLNRVGRIEASATPPAVIMPALGVGSEFPCFKTGDDTRRYIGCFYADGGSNVPRFKMTNFRYTYLADQSAAHVDTALLPAWALVYQPVDLSQLVSPNAKGAFIRTQLFNNAGPGAAVMSASVDGVTNGIFVGLHNGFNGTGSQCWAAEVPIESSTFYGVVPGPTVEFYIWLADWWE